MRGMEDYEATRRDFRLEVPDRFNYTVDVVDRWARDEPDKLALVAIHPDGRTATRHTFGEMSRLRARSRCGIDGASASRCFSGPHGR